METKQRLKLKGAAVGNALLESRDELAHFDERHVFPVECVEATAVVEKPAEPESQLSFLL